MLAVLKGNPSEKALNSFVTKKKIQFYTLKSNSFFLNWKVAKYTKNKIFFLLKFQGFTY